MQEGQDALPLVQLDQLTKRWPLIGQDLLQGCSRYLVVKGRLGGDGGDFWETGLDASNLILNFSKKYDTVSLLLGPYFVLVYMLPMALSIYKGHYIMLVRSPIAVIDYFDPYRVESVLYL